MFGVAAILAGAGSVAAQTAGGARLLVLLRDASALAVVDPASGTVLGQVPTVDGPHEVTASPDGRLAFGAVAYAALRGDDRVAVIDLETLEVVSEMPTGPDSGPGCMFWLAGS